MGGPSEAIRHSASLRLHSHSESGEQFLIQSTKKSMPRRLHNYNQTIRAQICGYRSTRVHRQRHDPIWKWNILIDQMMELSSNSEVTFRLCPVRNPRQMPLADLSIFRSQSWFQNIGTFQRFVLEIMFSPFSAREGLFESDDRAWLENGRCSSTKDEQRAERASSESKNCGNGRDMWPGAASLSLITIDRGNVNWDMYRSWVVNDMREGFLW
jgi:hypothetical protein